MDGNGIRLSLNEGLFSIGVTHADLLGYFPDRDAYEQDMKQGYTQIL